MNPALRSSAAHVFVASLDAPELHSDDAHHLGRVLRIGANDVVSVSDGAGRWGTARLERGDLVDVVPADEPVPSPPAVHIAASIPKGDRCEWMVQKLTELGVATITLIECERSVVRWDGPRAQRQLERLRRVAREAAMQSRRTWLPSIVGVTAFTGVATQAGVVLAEPAGSPLAARPPSCVIVGPEGGFSPAELALGVPQVSLGSTVLRVETAAIAAAVLLGQATA